MAGRSLQTQRSIATTCPYCGVGCGVLAKVDADSGEVCVAGDPDHPANFGRLCSKGSALHETLSLDDRLLQPMVGGHEVEWGTALDEVGKQFSQSIKEHGPDSVAFYVSGQLLSEDYYVANKLMKGFIGSANIDTNSRLCMASSVAGHKRAFGADTVPGCYEDLELADLIVLVGSNLAWCHPVLYQRIIAAKEMRPEMKVVVIDPRQTATCDIADLHLNLAPGTDVSLFNGLFHYLDQHGVANSSYIASHTTGYQSAIDEARHYDVSPVAECTELPEAEIAAFYEAFADTERVVTVYSQGVNQSTSGTDKVNAIINCHLLSGRIGKPGMGPFSVTGQPNAMGGREVGGLSNQLASHLDLDNPDHRQALKQFWNAPTIADRPGLKAVDLFRAVDEGKIKALWIMATNPVDSLPEADAVRSALQKCPFVVVSDVVRNTDTTALADVLLPAAAWGEKDGTVTNSERRISRQRAFLPHPGKAKPDWWIICEVAKRMGFSEGFDYSSPFEIFHEYVRSTSLETGAARDLDLSGFANVDADSYDTLEPTMWPCRPGEDKDNPKRFFADGGFFTADKKAKFIATPFSPPQTSVSETYPLVLNTGRIRDQWHTMTRSAKSARLMGHMGEPFVEIHPEDAERLAIAEAGLVEIASAQARVIVRALVTERQRKGSVFVPMHWTDQYAANARIDKAVSPETDPFSGQPESKFTPVRVSAWQAHWYGFAVLSQKPAELAADYWAIAKLDKGWSIELAGMTAKPDWQAYAASLLSEGQARDGQSDHPPLYAYRDHGKNQHRFAAFDGDRFKGALYVSPDPVEVSRNWACTLLNQNFDEPAIRFQLLAARAGKDQPDKGAIVCSCFSVGVNQIAEAVTREDCKSVDDIGRTLQAGTNCGSCRPEIRTLIDNFANEIKQSSQLENA